MPTTSPEAAKYDAKNAEMFRQRNQARDIKEDPKSSPRAQRRARLEFERLTADIYEYNRPMVHHIVNKFTRIASQDLAEEYEASAWVGMAKAVDNFDPDKGKFSTWAWRPIQREIVRAVRENEYNLTATDFESRKDILAAAAVLADELGRAASPDEVAGEAGVSVDSAKRVLEHRTSASLNVKVGDGEDTELGDLIVDDGTDAYAEVEFRQTLASVERYALPVLTERERMVVVRRFGLDGEPPEGLATIGKSISLSREAVRQMEARARAKMLHPIVARKLQFRGRSKGIC